MDDKPTKSRIWSFLSRVVGHSKNVANFITSVGIIVGFIGTIAATSIYYYSQITGFFHNTKSNPETSVSCATPAKINTINICFDFCHRSNKVVSCRIDFRNTGDNKRIYFGNRDNHSVPFATIHTESFGGFKTQNVITPNNEKITDILVSTDSSEKVFYRFDDIPENESKITLFEAPIWFVFPYDVSQEYYTSIRFQNINIVGAS